MSRRNLIWLVVVVVAGVVGWIAGGWVWGLIAVGIALLASEVVERTRRRRRAAASGAATPSVRSAITSKRGQKPKA